MNPRWIIASASLHLALCALAWRRPRTAPPTLHGARVQTVEFDFAPPAVTTPPASTRAVLAPSTAPSRRRVVAVARRPLEETPAPVATPPPAAPASTPVAPTPLPRGLFARMAQDTSAAWSALHPDGAVSTHRDTERPSTGTQGDPEARMREQSHGYVMRALHADDHTSAPGLRSYYWDLRRRMQETWRPSGAPTPTVVNAVLSDGFSSPEATERVMQRAVGPRYQPRQYAAGEALEASHPNASNGGPLVTVSPSLADRAEATARSTTTEIELDQDALGNITALRVVRPSHIAGFDREAERSVRAAVPLQGPFPRVGGRRSRWLFEVVTTRDPISPLRPTGVVAEFTVEFDEVTGWTELHWPGRPHARSRIVLLSEAPLAT